MPDTDQPSGARQAFGDFAPTFVDYTDDVLFGRVWPTPSWRPVTAAWSPSPP